MPSGSDKKSEGGPNSGGGAEGGGGVGGGGRRQRHGARTSSAAGGDDEDKKPAASTAAASPLPASAVLAVGEDKDVYEEYDVDGENTAAKGEDDADGLDHSHNTATSRTATSAYEDLLIAKDVQNSPLPIPITSGGGSAASSLRPPAVLGDAAAAANAGAISNNGNDLLSSGLAPPLVDQGDGHEGTVLAASASSLRQEDEDRLLEDSSSRNQHVRPHPHPPPVEAVPVTSVYQQVATAELYHGPPPSRRAQRQHQSPQSPGGGDAEGNGAGSKHDEEAGRTDQQAQNDVERMRLQRQRFKLCKLAILLAILIVVIVVPIVITNQRLAAGGSSSSNGNGSGNNNGGNGKPCFPSYEELESAVDDYLAGGTRKNKSLEAWGGPIGTWCVSQLPDGSGMDKLFSSVRNPRAAEFNDPLYYWDVSRIVSMEEMFRNATSFNQPLGSAWKVARVGRMPRMFLGASSFRQNLCEWGIQLDPNTLVHDMLAGTGCLETSDPNLSSSPLAQPPTFCTPCQL